MTGRHSRDPSGDEGGGGTGDSGEVETLPDGSLSIPVFGDEVVVTTRRVVRERIIVQTNTVTEDQVVTADVRREQVEVETVGDVTVHSSKDPVR